MLTYHVKCARLVYNSAGLVHCGTRLVQCGARLVHSDTRLVLVHRCTGLCFLHPGHHGLVVG